MNVFGIGSRNLQEENTRLKEELKASQEELSRLWRAISAMNTLQGGLDEITPFSDVYALLHDILTAAVEAVDSENGSLLLVDEDTGELVFVEVSGPNRDQLLGHRMRPVEGVVGWVATNRLPKLVPDVQSEARFSPFIDKKIDFQTKSLLCVPLWDGDRTLGVIEAVNTRSGKPFSEKDQDVLLLVARLASMAIVRAEGRGGEEQAGRVS